MHAIASFRKYEQIYYSNIKDIKEFIITIFVSLPAQDCKLDEMFKKTIDLILHINWIKKKNKCMIISIDVEKFL